MDGLFLLALSAFICTLFAVLEIVSGLGKMEPLSSVPPCPKETAPKISIIVAACNEEASLEAALATLLSLDYPNYEIIVVNDRSIDNTGKLLAEIEDKNPRLIVKTITTLPAGWLGKNHALHHGAQTATGEYLLFTDADIHLAPSTLARAINHVQRNNLDHLCLFFKNIAQGSLLNTLVMETGGGLLFLFKPWRARKVRSRFFMGVGAFNLVRKDVYKSIGGHSRIALHPIDDIMLGKMIKRDGFQQDCLLGLDMVTVEWYSSVPEMINGLMKNVFSLYHYKMTAVIFSVMLIAILGIAPPWLVLFGAMPTKIVALLAVGARFLSLRAGAKAFDVPNKPDCWPLVTPYITLYILLRAAITTSLNKGITWRGTFYPLKMLKTSEPLLDILGRTR